MTRTIPDSTMSRLSAFLSREIGINYPSERWNELEKGVQSAAREFGFGDLQECMAWLMSAPLTRGQVETLAYFLTVGETYFFRDMKMLEMVQGRILSPLVQSRRGKDQRLRIWSAGCSTGEEPYSVAILLHRLLGDTRDWNVTVLATDINHAALERGRGAVFGKWSFRGAPAWAKTLYFTEEDDERYRVIEPIRRMVSFEYLNLAEDSYPSLPTNTNAMDLILCRNVLMYFTHENAQTVIAKFHRCLLDKGWLIVGAAETSPRGYRGFESVSLEGATCYRKRSEDFLAAQRGIAPEQLPARREPEELPPFAAEPAEAPAAVAQQETPPPGGGRPGGGGAAGGEAVPEAPTGPDYLAAEELYRQGLYHRAALLLDELRARGGMPAQSLALLVRAQANQGKLDEALEVCDEALRLEKLDPELHYLRAEILQERGMTVEARLSLQRAIYLDPDSVLAHFALGRLLLDAGKTERGVRHLDTALALLDKLPPEAVVAGSEGVTAGRLGEVLRALTGGAKRAQGGSR